MNAVHPRLVELGRTSANTERAPDIANLEAAHQAARRTRTQFLVDILEGRLHAVDAPWKACATGDRHLMKVRLAQLLATAPHWDVGRTNAVLGHIAEVLAVEASAVHTENLGWLTDSRSAGRRILAWLDAFRPRTTPWPGFPYAPIPERYPANGPGSPPHLEGRNKDGITGDRR